MDCFLRKAGSLSCIYWNAQYSTFCSKEFLSFFFTGRILELTCLKLCLKPNLTHSLSSFNLPFMTFLKPVKEAQIILEVFLNHSDFENITRTCQDITSKFQMCSLCLVCEPKGNVSSISQEETSTGKQKVKIKHNID